nr:hypothetical protein [Zea mays]
MAPRKFQPAPLLFPLLVLPRAAAARPTSPRCAAPRRNAAVPAAPAHPPASSLLPLRACQVLGIMSREMCCCSTP